MKLATLLLTHGAPELTCDTVDAIETWVDKRTLVLVDEAGWPIYENRRVGAAKVEKGFFHKHNRNVYRNTALGLKKLYGHWPDADWYLSTEYDCLFTSDDFKNDLEAADALNAWCVGTDLRRFDFQMPLLQSLLGRGPLQSSYYFLGCCIFFSRKYLATLCESGFLDRLLEATQTFVKSEFPGYPRWSLEEELWPTAATAFGGNLCELVCFKGWDNQWQPRIANDPRLFYPAGDTEAWRGYHHRYPIRFAPDISPAECKAGTTIIHPSKSVAHPVRQLARGCRDAIRQGGSKPAVIAAAPWHRPARVALLCSGWPDRWMNSVAFHRKLLSRLDVDTFFHFWDPGLSAAEKQQIVDVYKPKSYAFDPEPDFGLYDVLVRRPDSSEPPSRVMCRLRSAEKVAGLLITSQQNSPMQYDAVIAVPTDLTVSMPLDDHIPMLTPNRLMMAPVGINSIDPRVLVGGVDAVLHCHGAARQAMAYYNDGTAFQLASLLMKHVASNPEIEFMRGRFTARDIPADRSKIQPSPASELRTRTAH